MQDKPHCNVTVQQQLQPGNTLGNAYAQSQTPSWLMRSMSVQPGLVLWVMIILKRHAVVHVLDRRQQVLDTATSSLRSRSQLSSQAAADAVAAIAMLEGLDSTAALQRFLAARRCWAEQLLDAALADSQPDEQTAGQVLAQWVQQVQSCIAQVRLMVLACIDHGWLQIYIPGMHQLLVTKPSAVCPNPWFTHSLCVLSRLATCS